VKEICEEAGFTESGLSIGVAVALGVVGFILGWAFGKRKELLKMLKSLQMKRDMKAAAKAAVSGAGDQQQEEDDDRDEDEKAKEVMDDFLNRDAVPGLDDHPDTHVNRIMIYQVKQMKEQRRAEKALQDLLAAQNFEPGYLESLSKEERKKIEDSLIKDSGGVKSGGGVGSVAGLTRRWGSNVNATRILVNEGMRMAEQRSASDMSAEAKASQELREKMRNIDKHLATELEIDVSRELDAAKRRSGQGLRASNALEAANATKVLPFKDMHEVLRFDERHDFARRGRSRVAPPLDHGGASLESRIARSSMRRQSTAGGPRRASTRGRGSPTRRESTRKMTPPSRQETPPR